MKRKRAVGTTQVDGRRGDAVVCPCGSQRPYGGCCAPLHAGVATAADAAALMRSRYSAYVRGRKDYLLATWHPSTRPPGLDDAAATRWLGLADPEDTRRPRRMPRPSSSSPAIASPGAADGLHEISRFVREEGRWHYLDGEFPDAGG
jgi:SEC-C motif-containing protein